MAEELRIHIRGFKIESTNPREKQRLAGARPSIFTGFPSGNVNEMG
jgi:hypothetical protein